MPILDLIRSQTTKSIGTKVQMESTGSFLLNNPALLTPLTLILRDLRLLREHCIRSNTELKTSMAMVISHRLTQSLLPHHRIRFQLLALETQEQMLLFSGKNQTIEDLRLTSTWLFGWVQMVESG